MDHQSANQTSNNSQSITEIVESCRVRLASGATVEQCVADFPAYAAELRQLLPVVERAQRLVPEVAPSVVERSRRRFRAYVEAQPADTGRPVRRSGWIWRLAGPVLAAVILTTSGLGLAQAANRTLPDSPLYSVKQVQENLGQVLYVTPAARAEYQVGLARQRLGELNRAEVLGKPVVARISALGMLNATELAVDYTLKTRPAERKVLEARLRPLIQSELRSLEALAAEVPPQYTPSIRQAELRLKQADQRLAK